MKKILITGVTGFAGSHLAEYIIDNKLGEIHGTFRGKSTDLANINHVKSSLNLVKCDITDYFVVKQTIKDIDPDYIFHLAAQSFVPESWKSPRETLETNIMGALNIYEAVREVNPGIKIQIASSSEIYGMVPEDELPIKETNQLRPLSPYGVSKVAMDLLGYQYHESYGLNIVRTRAFNHTGPRRGDVFVASNWTKQVAEIEKGTQEPVLMVGSLTSKRDFTDVRDVVRAYWLSLEKCEPGEAYNICSGKTQTMQELLDMILSFTDKKIQVKVDPKRMRPSDVKVLLGDYSKFNKQTGWKPEIPLEKTIKDLLDYWRKKLA
ncbi:MAG TPA: GDP-mannose 4,6-dehydratase [archaeon]|nr:GDP-mannose 4,6-dehydratase [archaeon]